MFKDFEHEKLFIVDERDAQKGSKPAPIKGVCYPSSPIEDAVGTDIEDICVIEFDDETYQALVQLGRDRMATLQELADEAFADVLKKHGVPIDLKDALRKSVGALKPAQIKKPSKRPAKRA